MSSLLAKMLMSPGQNLNDIVFSHRRKDKSHRSFASVGVPRLQAGNLV